MNTVSISRPLALSVVVALATSALSFTAASAAPLPVPVSLEAMSQDGDAFDLAKYAAGDITVQALDSSSAAVDVDDSQDLSFVWNVTPFAPNTAPVQVPVNGTDTQATDVNGRFVVPLPVAQGPGEYTLTAELGADTAGDHPIASTTFPTLRVGNAAPAGSTAEVTGLGTSTPGLAQPGTLTIEAPGGTPVVGQVFSLTVDHGFFTPVQGPQTSVVGARAGDLARLGTTLTGVTDADGQIDFSLGIARDAGFDDDGLVTTTVKTGTGPAGSATAVWNSGTEDDPPLNGQVALALAPASEQDGPVNPALAGNRTLYDVFALDQFGNRVGGVPIDLAPSGYLKDYELSDDFAVSDFDTFGDIWLLSNVAARTTITGTWEEAPTYLYTDTAGDAASVIPSTRTATGSITTSTYEIQFNASRFSLTSSATDVVGVGTAVSETVRVVDQQNNPVAGYEVRFFRNGPDSVNGDVVATRTTNARGEATYTFVGTKRGRAQIKADVTDGTSRRLLTGSVVFGATIKAHLDKGRGGAGADRLTVSTRTLAAGARVQLYRIATNGKRVPVQAKKLNSKGKVSFKIRDRNRKAYTTYFAVVRSTSNTVADQSNSAKIR